MNSARVDLCLSQATLADLTWSFEMSLGLRGVIAILEPDDRHYFGVQHADQSPSLREVITVDDQVIANLVCYADVQEAYLPRALQHFAHILSHLATETWRRQLLADEVLERYDELNLIYGLGTSFVQGTPSDQIVQNVLEETNRILRADAGVIYVWDIEKNVLTPVSSFGVRTGPEFWGGRIRELALSTLYAYDQAQLFENDRVICAPLRYDEELLGSLVLVYEQTDRTFNANDVNLLTTLMHNTALFLHAARLVDRLAFEKTQLEATLKELKATKDKLSRAERLSIIGQTMSSLVHDMRKPLSNVMGYAGLLQEPDITFEERHQFASQIVKYVEVFSSMAQEVLDYTLGEDSVQKKTMDVEDYMKMVADLLLAPGLERTVRIVVNSEQARGHLIAIDPQRFTRVFQNLVNNAVDAIESRGGTRVEIAVVPDGGRLRFSVTDDGPGVPPEIVSNLFEPFVTMGKSHGTGLGLAIVERMVAIHGGQIHYEQAPGGGARFVFSLPAVKNGASRQKQGLREAST